jgi:hypothetical protein
MKVRIARALMMLLATFAAAHAQAPSSATTPESAASPGQMLAAPPAVADWAGEGRSSPPEQFWVEADFLLWWVRGASLPPLVTSSPAGTPISQAGVLGASGTTVLFGDSRVNDDARAGGRVAVGAWFDDAHIYGVEADFFLLEGKAASFSARSDGNPILARPFLDALTGGESSQRVAFPGDLSGSVQAADGTSGLLGVGVLLRERLCCGDGWRLDVLGGYRSLKFSDRLGVTENLTNENPNSPNFIPLGANILVADRFLAKNDLQAIDLGLTAEYRQGPLSLSVRGRVAVGYNRQEIEISGGTIVTAAPAPPAASVGGLLAQTSNIGRTSRDDGSVAEQVDLRLGWQVTPNLTASLGYSYLYWTDVVRAADQIDRTVNPNLIPPSVSPAAGPNRPVFALQRNVLSAQGLNLQLEYRF